MRHARSDYDRIQDPFGKIGEDEPVFLARAYDRAAPGALIGYAAELKRLGGSQEGIDLALHWAEVIRKWQEKNGSKLPDIPSESVDKA